MQRLICFETRDTGFYDPSCRSFLFYFLNLYFSGVENLNVEILEITQSPREPFPLPKQGSKESQILPDLSATHGNDIIMLTANSLAAATCSPAG